MALSENRTPMVGTVDSNLVEGHPNQHVEEEHQFTKRKRTKN